MGDGLTIKTSAELEVMRQAGAIVANVLRRVALACQPGVSTKELDALAAAYVREQGAEPSFKGYHGYPASLCVAVNEEVVHSIPGPRKLREGDIVGLDFGAYFNGLHADAALTVPVGKISDEAGRLLKVTEEALYLGIAQARVGNRVGDISNAIQRHVERHGYSVVRQLVGHGVGRSLHEKPEVPNYGQPGCGLKLRDGMTLAIEPMVNQGVWEVRFMPDQWTVVTADGKLSAHFEHTIAVTKDGPRILTVPAVEGTGQDAKEIAWRHEPEP